LDIRPFDPAAPSPATAVGGAVVARDSGGSVAEATAAAAPEPSLQDVQEAVRTANAALVQRQAALEFTVDAATHRVVVRLVDTQEQKVLRQVPSEEMLAIAKAVERMELTLLRNRA
jgi:flagellar protein FlaG